MKCILCGNTIPASRIVQRWTKYCSTICSKRSWYLLKSTSKSFGRDKEFWKTETGIGYKWEQYAVKKLGIGAVHLPFNRGPDIDWLGQPVDVKVCELYRRKIKRGVRVKSKQAGCWTFNRNGEKRIDWFFCIGLVNGKVKKEWLIPGSVFPKKGAVLGQHSKYDVYLR